MVYQINLFLHWSSAITPNTVARQQCSHTGPSLDGCQHQACWWGTLTLHKLHGTFHDPGLAGQDFICALPINFTLLKQMSVLKIEERDSQVILSWWRLEWMTNPLWWTWILEQQCLSFQKRSRVDCFLRLHWNLLWSISFTVEGMLKMSLLPKWSQPNWIIICEKWIIRKMNAVQTSLIKATFIVLNLLHCM